MRQGIVGEAAPASASREASGVHHLRTTCRACDGRQLHRTLELGPQPLANAFPADAGAAAAEAFYPLDVYLCEDCGLVQLLDVISPEVLFRDYIYVSGTSDTVAAHNVEYARTVTDLLSLGPSDLVVEVASNDGSLLGRFADLGVRTLGVEPALNIADIARRRGIETISEFFDEQRGIAIRQAHGGAAAVIGNNVLAHVDDPRGFLTGARRLLRPNGLVIVEVPYLQEMLDRLEYDTVYHEHLCYFSVGALMRLCEGAGLVIRRLDRVTIHGGSIRLYAGRRDDFGDHHPDAMAFVAAERERGLLSLDRHLAFAADVRRNKASLCELLLTLRESGARVAAYGAPAKGNTLLNYCGIGTDLVPYTFDRSPHKVGRLTPGMHLPVLPVSEIEVRKPDYLLVLAWNFAEEIMRQQSAHAARGGRFILPVPTPVVV